MSLTTIVVAWKGPYRFAEAIEERGTRLYLVFGRNRHGRKPAHRRLLYHGISENKQGVGRRIRAHEGQPYDHRDNRWWIGRITQPGRPRRWHLEAAEWMLVYFEGPKHNIKKKQNAPSKDVLLVNKWFTVHDEARTRRTGVMAGMSDVLLWEQDHLRHAGKLQVVRFID